MKDPIVEVTRSHSKTIYPNGAYKSESVFCSAKTTVNLSEAKEASEDLFVLCHSEVEKDCNKILGLPDPKPAPTEVKLVTAEPEPPPFKVLAAEELSNIRQDKPKRGKKTAKLADTQNALEDTQSTYTATDDDIPSILKGATPQADRLRSFAEKAAQQTGRSYEFCRHNVKSFVINYLACKTFPTPDEQVDKLEPALLVMEGLTEAQITRLCEEPFMLVKEIKTPAAATS